ncbi:hypothetical protein [Saccharibacillus kuerlensis]|uniref:Uncharacterized protein n=1 Tax=Saccharibacillus kuerlensis TaxID=459527 RepID=A0ABQ2L9T3_9BACL|nr:hypothetical protein [Saccharibacillus kuerlensis]GGO06097.1 hypothetical protein GCM10010969_33140 [Saccharibacillus kuerlensis]
MGRQTYQIPFGTEPAKRTTKGTLIFYDSFEHITDEQLETAAQAAASRSFSQLVLYPLHEATVKRLTGETASAFYKRDDRLHEWRRDQQIMRNITVENWDGKRKKYTPLEAALRFMDEKYPSPLFLYLTSDTANRFASFATFEEWIVRIRLVLDDAPERPHPRLEKFRHRWDTVDELLAKEKMDEQPDKSMRKPSKH